jgi:hypothetical protein
MFGTWNSMSLYRAGSLLRWNFRKWDVGVWTGSRWLSIGTGGVGLVTGVINFKKP